MENQNRLSSPAYRPKRTGVIHRIPTRPPLDQLVGTAFGRLILLFVIVIFLFLPFASVAGFLAYFQVFDKIVPGVVVGDTHLGGSSLQTAAVQIHQQWNLERKILVGVTLNGQIKTWQLTPDALGLSVNAVETARNAYAVAHDQDWLNEIDQMIRSSIEGWGIAPVVVFNRERARAGLEALSVQISVPPTNASLRIDGGQIIETSAIPGIRLDIEKTLDQITADPHGVLLSGTLVLSVMPVQAEVSDLSALKLEVERLMNTSLTISGYDPIIDKNYEWQVPQEQLLSWLRIDPPGTTNKVEISLDQVKDYFRQLSSSLGADRWVDADRYAPQVADAILQNKPVQVLISHHPTTYTVQSGDTLLKIGWKTGIPYWRIAQANPNVKPDKVQVGQELSIPSKDDLLPLPVIQNKRIVISISQQRLWTFENGQQRSVHIISTGIDRSPTQPGVFQVQTHELEAYASEWRLTMPHFMGIYEAWPGFMNGLHGLPTLSNGQRLWENILGKPASYGCIILKLADAEDLYNWAENGVVVEIQP